MVQILTANLFKDPLDKKKSQIAVGSGGARGTSADIEITANEILKTKELSAQLLADNCGQTFEKIMKDFDRDYWMDAKESLEYGIVDGVLDKI